MLNREELIELGKKIVSAEGTEEEFNEMFELFNKNVIHPSGASLFFNPDNYKEWQHKISEYNPSVEEIVA